jgi:hypothetical protein
LQERHLEVDEKRNKVKKNGSADAQGALPRPFSAVGAADVPWQPRAACKKQIEIAYA